jgi:hypothetical protein
MNNQIKRNACRIGPVLLGLILLPFLSLAQNYDSEYDYIKKTFKEDKKTMVGKFLKLSEKESTVFWPLYEEYENERMELGQERWAELQRYMEDYDKMDDAKSSDWLKKIYDYSDRFNIMIRSSTKKIEAGMGGRRAIQFYEIETYFNLQIRSWIYSEFPLVGEDDR